MSLVLGIVAFALCIGVALAIHEAAHLGTARMFGMKVRRYFIGFGPTIWSTKRGETEYGLKAIPAGGFCDIAGMTAMDELKPGEYERAMWRYPVWKRTVVMAAGSISHFILGFLVLYFLAVSAGLPNIGQQALPPIVDAVSPCAQSTVLERGEPRTQPCGPGAPAPAREAGLRASDQIVAVNGTPTPTWPEASTLLQNAQGPTRVQVDRDGERTTLNVDVARVKSVTGNKGNYQTVDVGAIGVLKRQDVVYSPLAAVGGTLSFTGDAFVNVLHGIARLPEKVPALISAIGGEQRDLDTPMSVVGASRVGGEVAAAGLWEFFFLLFALLNFALGVFNLLPLLPMDGGHIVVIWYEKVRDWLRKLRGLSAAGPVDYTKLVPVTMVVLVIGGAYFVVVLLADVVNPIQLPGLE